MRIAICDDDPIELQNISTFIEEYFKSKNLPFNCRSFSSSTELANTAPGEFDLYLLDVLMPALNGIELAKEIRSFDRLGYRFREELSSDTRYIFERVKAE